MERRARRAVRREEVVEHSLEVYVRQWRSSIILGIFVGVAVIVFGLIISSNQQFASLNSGTHPVLTTKDAPANVIANENAHPGTSKWKIPLNKGASTQIQAYASATSVAPGQTLTFYVSTQQEGTRYTLDVYRMGWYGGEGGRLMNLTVSLTGKAQGYYNVDTRMVVNCHSCHIDPTSGLAEANWQPSYGLSVPPDWPTGVYLAKFTDEQDIQTYVPFVVRGNTHARYIVCTADTTYAAYNDWGGYSLYDADSSSHTSENAALPRGEKVSFDRPYTSGQGGSQVLVFEINTIRWLERKGYDLSYISDVDLHEDPSQLLTHHAYLSIGHDEYWTKEMRDGVERARDRGVGLAFLGADAAYWQMRFEPSAAGQPDRIIVCYKVSSFDHTLAHDPLYGKDNSRLTALWRDPVIGRPENALIGIMYSSLTHQRLGYAWHMSSGAKSALLDGTGLQPNTSYGCNYVGYEWDRIFDNGSTPSGLQILATSPTVNNDQKPDMSNTTYYIAPSGAFVFASGSIYWGMALDNYRLHADAACANQDYETGSIQKLMEHVMEEVAVLHPSGQLLAGMTPTPVGLRPSRGYVKTN